MNSEHNLLGAYISRIFIKAKTCWELIQHCPRSETVTLLLNGIMEGTI